MRKITDHMSNGNAISISDVFIKLIKCNNIPKKTMAGWKQIVEWKDGSTSWVPLKYIKASNPLQLA